MASERTMNRAELLKKRTAWLSYGSVCWHAAAFIIAITAGILADSIALTGFGLESIIQTVIASLAIWRFQIARGKTAGEGCQTAERRLLFILGIMLFLLALYMLNESGSRLFYREMSGKSITGIVLSIMTFMAMAVFAFLKLQTSKALESGMLRADAKENAIRCSLSLVLFFGLWLHVRHGWWWADALAALLMVPFILREGWKAIEDSKRSSASQTTKTFS